MSVSVSLQPSHDPEFVEEANTILNRDSCLYRALGARIPPLGLDPRPRASDCVKADAAGPGLEVLPWPFPVMPVPRGPHTEKPGMRRDTDTPCVLATRVRSSSPQRVQIEGQF